MYPDNTVIPIILSVLNVLMGFTLAVLATLTYFIMPKTEPWRWIKVFHAALGLGWGIIYVIFLRETRNYVIQDNPAYMLVRPFIALTIAGLLVGNISTYVRFSRRRTWRYPWERSR